MDVTPRLMHHDRFDRTVSSSVEWKEYRLQQPDSDMRRIITCMLAWLQDMDDPAEPVMSRRRRLTNYNIQGRAVTFHRGIMSPS